MREPRKTWRQEPIFAAMAFFVVFWLTLFVGTVVLVGAVSMAPKAAALAMLAPAALLALAGAAYTPTRHFFGRLFGIG